MTEDTTNQVKRIPNPTGKGGFADHPENRNKDGRWDKNNSFSYWLNYFKSITIPEFREYKDKHPEMTMSALAAYVRAGKMIDDLGEFQVVANRTEGMPKQNIEYGVDETIGEIEIKISKHAETPTGSNDSIPKEL